MNLPDPIVYGDVKYFKTGNTLSGLPVFARESDFEHDESLTDDLLFVEIQPSVLIRKKDFTDTLVECMACTLKAGDPVSHPPPVCELTWHPVPDVGNYHETKIT